MKHASLFSGIGGFDLAAEWAGWENMFHCEWNEFGQKVLNYYWPKAISYGDITKTDFTIWRGRIDVLTGGFPCQPYSLAGKRLGKEDERHLWPEMLRAIREIQPKWVVGENVLGITNWNEGLVFNEVQSDLEAQGYEVQAYVLPAAGINAPHRRDRVWFVAKNTKCDGRLCREPEQEGAENGQFGNISTRDSNGIREQENAGITSDTKSTGAGVNNRGVREGISGINDRETTKTKTITDTNGNGFKWINGKYEEQSSKRGEYALNDLEQDDAMHTSSQRLQGSKKRGSPMESWEESNKQPTGRICSTWQNFPTQPPICGGDDGVSGRLDGITFPKWRAESIKAYGNAIVPQVVYQIFKAINQYENAGN